MKAISDMLKLGTATLTVVANDLTGSSKHKSNKRNLGMIFIIRFPYSGLASSATGLDMRGRFRVTEQDNLLGLRGVIEARPCHRPEHLGSVPAPRRRAEFIPTRRRVPFTPRQQLPF